MAQEIAAAYVSIYPKTIGFGKAVNEAVNGAASGTGTRVSSIALGSSIGNFIAAGVSRVAGAISGSIGSALARVDTIEGFSDVMANLGYDAEEAEAAIALVGERLLGLPTTTDAMVSMIQQLSAATGDLTLATDLGLAFNDMLVAAGANALDTERAFRQFNQAVATGKVTADDWYTLQQVMPGQLAQIAQELLGAGASSNELFEALKSGTITMDEFLQTIIRMDNEGGESFTSFSEAAHSGSSGILTSFANMQTAITRGVANIIAAFGSDNIIWAVESVKNGINSAFKAITPPFEKLGNIVRDLREGNLDLASSANSYASTLRGKVAPIMDKMSGVFEALQKFAEVFNINIRSVGSYLGAGFVNAQLMASGVSLQMANSMEIVAGKMVAARGICAELTMTVLPALATRIAAAGETVAGFAAHFGGLEARIGFFRGFAETFDRFATTAVVKLAPLTGHLGQASEILGGFAKLTRVLNPISMIISSMVTMFATNEDYRNSVIDVAKEIGSGLVPILVQLGVGFVQIASAILPTVMKVFDELTPVFADIGLLIMELVANVLPVVGAVIEALMPVIVNIVEAVTNFVEAVLPIVVIVIQTITSVIRQLMPFIKQVITIVAKVVSTIIGVIGNVIAIIIDIATVVADVAGEVIAGFAGMFEFVSGIISIVLTAIGGFIEGFVAGVTGAIDLIVGGITAFVNNIVEKFTSIATSAQEIWQEIVDTITGFVMGVVDDVSGFFDDMVSSIGGTVSGILAAIQSGFNPAIDFIKGLAGEALQWGADIIQGIIDGITGAIGGVIDAVSGVASSIADFLHFSEPDKGPLSNFHTFMPDMMALMAQGIHDNLGKVRREALEVARALDMRSSITADIQAGISDGRDGSVASRADAAVIEELRALRAELANGSQNIYLDSGALVGGISRKMDAQLGRLQMQGAR